MAGLAWLKRYERIAPVRAPQSAALFTFDRSRHAIR
jgi:hypothetical protein